MKNFLTHSQISPEMVSVADGFATFRYLQTREKSPPILELEEKGADRLPNIKGALADVFGCMRAAEPQLQSEAETPANLAFWRDLLGKAMETSAYQQAHAMTMGDTLLSFLGTVSMGTEIVGKITREEAEKLQDLEQAQGDAEQASQDLADAQAEAESAEELMQQLAQVAAQGGAGKPSQHKMGQLQSQAQAAQGRATKAQMSLEQAQAKAQEIRDQLMGKSGTEEAAQKAERRARLAQAAATKAKEQVQKVSDTLSAWGVEEGTLSREDPAEAMKIVKRMQGFKEFELFQELLGKTRQIAQRKSSRNARPEGHFVPRYEYGDDLSRVEFDDLMKLLIPGLEVEFYNNWMDRSFRLQAREFVRNMGKGGIIAVEDGSGSMRGEKSRWAKANVLSLAYYAKLENRDFAWIQFGSASDNKNGRMICKVYPKGQLAAKDMLEIAETFRNSSGTDFEWPLDKAAEVIKKAGLKDPDVCLITDGISAVTPKWLTEFLAVKSQFNFNVITVVMDVGETSDATVAQFSDRVEKVSRFTAETAGQQVIAHLT